VIASSKLMYCWLGISHFHILIDILANIIVAVKIVAEKKNAGPQKTPYQRNPVSNSLV